MTFSCRHSGRGVRPSPRRRPLTTSPPVSVVVQSLSPELLRLQQLCLFFQTVSWGNTAGSRSRISMATRGCVPTGRTSPLPSAEREFPCMAQTFCWKCRCVEMFAGDALRGPKRTINQVFPFVVVVVVVVRCRSDVDREGRVLLLESCEVLDVITPMPFTSSRHLFTEIEL